MQYSGSDRKDVDVSVSTTAFGSVVHYSGKVTTKPICLNAMSLVRWWRQVDEVCIDFVVQQSIFVWESWPSGGCALYLPLQDDGSRLYSRRRSGSPRSFISSDEFNDAFCSRRMRINLVSGS
jgi:hypothetical protein